MDIRHDGIDGDQSAHTSNRKSARTATVEIITRGERRRRWAPEQKREIVAESYGGELTPTEVARKHGISSGQLYTWRREMLRLRSAVVTRAEPRFAEVEVGGPTPPAPSRAPTPDTAEWQPGSAPCGRMEIVLPGGVAIRVDGQVDGDALRRVLAALGRR
jgi:transposase